MNNYHCTVTLRILILDITDNPIYIRWSTTMICDLCITELFGDLPQLIQTFFFQCRIWSITKKKSKIHGLWPVLKKRKNHHNWFLKITFSYNWYQKEKSPSSARLCGKRHWEKKLLLELPYNVVQTQPKKTGNMAPILRKVAALVVIAGISTVVSGTLPSRTEESGRILTAVELGTRDSRVNPQVQCLFVAPVCPLYTFLLMPTERGSLSF